MCKIFGDFVVPLRPVIQRDKFMWLLLAFCSAALLGFYDVFKKKSLAGNAVLPVLGLNTLFSRSDLPAVYPDFSFPSGMVAAYPVLCA